MQPLVVLALFTVEAQASGHDTSSSATALAIALCNLGQWSQGKWLMIGVELLWDRTTKTPASELRNRVNHLAFEHGLLLIGCGVSTTRFIPPLIISRAEIDEGLAIFEHALTLAETEMLYHRLLCKGDSRSLLLVSLLLFTRQT